MTEVYEDIMKIPRRSKVPQLLTSLFIKGNLVSFLILFLLFLYSVWDMVEIVCEKCSLKKKRLKTL